MICDRCIHDNICGAEGAFEPGLIYCRDFLGWTPISEGLPKENQTVIASTKYGVYPEARYSKKYGWEWAYEAGADYWRELEDVLAWMPLPKRYEPQEGSDKCSKCEYYINPDYTRCKECGAERSDKE